MSVQDHIAASLERNIGMLEATLADFSDADMLVRPAAGANHAAWQIGHLILSEYGMISACGVKMPELPAGFQARFTKDTAKCDDPAAFPKKTELLATFKQQRSATVAWVKTLSEKDMDAASPERLRGWVPTIGQLTQGPAGHFAMHLGQIQVIRRKLGKPALF